jgi:hypothetical protein
MMAPKALASLAFTVNLIFSPMIFLRRMISIQDPLRAGSDS